MSFVTEQEFKKVLEKLKRRICCLIEQTEGALILNINDDEPDLSQQNTFQVLNNGDVYLVDGDGIATQVLTEFSNEIDIYLVAGQSNAKGMSGASGAANSPNPATDTVYQYYLSTFSQVTDEVGNANTGSAWPSFGITYNNLTGRRIAFVPTAVNSTSQTAAADTGAGNWSPTGTLWQASVDAVNNAITAATTAGFTPIFRGVLWSQGESDAIAINATTITSGDYQTALTTMIANYRTEFGSNTPFYIFRTGTQTDASDVGYLAVRTAQEAVVTANPLLNKMVYRNTIDFPARGLMVDVVHYTQTGYNEMGRYGAENVVTYYNTESWQKQAGNVYFNGSIGIGIDIPDHQLTVSGSGINAKFLSNTTGVGGLRIENSNAGTGAFAGIRFYNDTGIHAQLLQGSSTSASGVHVLMLHSIPGQVRLASNSSDIELATGSNLTANTKLRVKNNGQVAIGSDPTPIASSILDLQSTTQAFCPPRMTTVQKNAIATPSAGMVVYDTTLNKLCVYTTAWETIVSA